MQWERLLQLLIEFVPDNKVRSDVHFGGLLAISGTQHANRTFFAAITLHRVTVW